MSYYIWLINCSISDTRTRSTYLKPYLPGRGGGRGFRIRSHLCWPNGPSSLDGEHFALRNAPVFSAESTKIILVMKHNTHNNSASFLLKVVFVWTKSLIFEETTFSFNGERKPVIARRSTTVPFSWIFLRARLLWSWLLRTGHRTQCRQNVRHKKRGWPQFQRGTPQKVIPVFIIIYWYEYLVLTYQIAKCLAFVSYM